MFYCPMLDWKHIGPKLYGADGCYFQIMHGHPKLKGHKYKWNLFVNGRLNSSHVVLVEAQRAADEIHKTLGGL